MYVCGLARQTEDSIDGARGREGNEEIAQTYEERRAVVPLYYIDQLMLQTVEN